MSVKREKGYHKEWMKKISEEMRKCRIHRYQDLMYDTGRSNKRPYDGHILYEGMYMPHEAKYQDGGETWNVQAWKDGRQGHQYGNLLRDYKHGGYPFLIIFWKYKNRVHPKIVDIGLLAMSQKVTLAILNAIDNIEDLGSLLKSVLPYNRLPKSTQQDLDSDMINSRRG